MLRICPFRKRRALKIVILIYKQKHFERKIGAQVFNLRWNPFVFCRARFYVTVLVLLQLSKYKRAALSSGTYGSVPEQVF